MELFNEDFLKELERQDSIRSLYWKVRLDVFDVQTWMQTRKTETRYFATIDNKLQVESTLEIKNPTELFGKLLYITLVFVSDISTKKELATKQEVEKSVKQSTEYIISLITHLFRVEKDNIMRQLRTSGSVRGLGGNAQVYSARLILWQKWKR